MSAPNQILNEQKEKDCCVITHERKYYEFKATKTFINRSLRPPEWQISPCKRWIHVPKQGRERILNEAASMRYIAENTDIPVPKLHCVFEDDGAAYLVTEYIEGVLMSQLSSEQCEIVQKDLERHRETLRGLRSSKIGGPTGLVVPPYRHNVIVDPKTLKIKAINDWEYAGFCPEYFEEQFWKRPGPSVAIKGESHDTEKLLEFLESMEI